ncbi:hypothetical protein BV22DRAFT_1140704 [Leucogyrophana mollusca]|uniref:Uncharacterized protein n=1 Tax=Leucogyrophana mollusca TaxID=85980 RepID=A0ACB8BWC6_9AGAM|nr:hypothetical protein BV22DRAFT_1140704 [Leucogyrophana mollusca]
MGVKSPWSLLEPVGRPVPLENIEGKALAIDSGIWIYQFQAIMRNKDGLARPVKDHLPHPRRIAQNASAMLSGPFVKVICEKEYALVSMGAGHEVLSAWRWFRHIIASAAGWYGITKHGPKEESPYSVPRRVVDCGA